MTYRVRYPEVRATELAPVVDGVAGALRLFAIEHEGSTIALVDAQTFHVLFAPANGTTAPKETAAPKEKTPKAQAPPAAMEAPRATKRTLNAPEAQILKLITAKPSSSKELIQSSGLQPPQVYLACSELKRMELAVVKEDDQDLVKRYHAVPHD